MIARQVSILPKTVLIIARPDALAKSAWEGTATFVQKLQLYGQTLMITDTALIGYSLFHIWDCRYLC